MAIYKDGVRYVVYYNGARYVDSLTKPKCAIPSFTLLSVCDAKTVYVGGQLYSPGATVSGDQTVSAVYSYSIQDGSTLSLPYGPWWTICTTTKQVSYHRSFEITAVKTTHSWSGFHDIVTDDFFTTRDNYYPSEIYKLSTALNGPINEKLNAV